MTQSQRSGRVAAEARNIVRLWNAPEPRSYGGTLRDFGLGLTAELTCKPSHSAPTLLALILRNPGPHQVRIDTVIHRRAR